MLRWNRPQNRKSKCVRTANMRRSFSPEKAHALEQMVDSIDSIHTTFEAITCRLRDGHAMLEGRVSDGFRLGMPFNISSYMIAEITLTLLVSPYLSASEHCNSGRFTVSWTSGGYQALISAEADLISIDQNSAAAHVQIMSGDKIMLLAQGRLRIETVGVRE